MINICRYCTKPATDYDPYRCQKCIDLFELHKLPLEERDCDYCEKAATVGYRCLRCDQRFFIAGVYRWSWQGKGHWHDADNQCDYDPMHQPCGDHPHHVSVPVL